MKKLLTMIGAAAVAVGANASSVTIDSVVQRWTWNNKVDITYTIDGGQDLSREVFARLVFTATIGGTPYTIDGRSIGADASDGQHTVTWIPSSSLRVKDLNCTMTAQLLSAEIPSGNDYMVIDLASGEVTYEGRFSTITPSTNRYNTAEYKTSKMVLRKIPRWADRAALPNATTFDALGGYPTGSDAVAANVPRRWATKRDYYIGMFLVTQRQYETVYGSNPSLYTTDATDNVAAHRPVEQVSWNDLRRPAGSTIAFPSSSPIPAVFSDSGTFFQRLNYRTGLYFDLPTEMMFEIASRAGLTDDYWGSVPKDDYAVLSTTSGKITWAVGSKLSNDWGMYDTWGNVYEWMRDSGGVSISALNPTDALTPYGTATSRNRIKSTWHGSAADISYSFREQYAPDTRQKYLGFRVSLVVE